MQVGGEVLGELSMRIHVEVWQLGHAHVGSHDAQWLISGVDLGADEMLRLVMQFWDLSGAELQ